jgi:hypothetical protein
LTNLNELERIAAKYAHLKKSVNSAELAQLASSIVDSISLPSFSFPVKGEALSANGTTTYLYENNATFPALYDFLGELLHAKGALEVRDAKFGPGEIIVTKQSKEEADVALGMCVKELQELVHARESEIFSKYADTP